jgi:pyoverdine/dityrosine biosynthesis protein Dit1
MEDKAADEGVRVFGKSVNKVAAGMMKRHIQYSNLVKIIHNHFIARFHARKNELTTKG